MPYNRHLERASLPSAGDIVKAVELGRGLNYGVRRAHHRLTLEGTDKSMSKAPRTCAGRLFGIFWEISGTEGTIYNSGERFNELQVFRMEMRNAIGDSKPSMYLDIGYE